jgi:hypothetical protein
MNLFFPYRAENDKKTDVYFTGSSDVSCSSLPNTMMESGRHSIPVTRESHTSQASSRISPTPFQTTYRKL